MAAVLDALASYVKKLLQDMAQEEVSVLLGVSGEITKLEDNMEGLRAFLADAERRRITDASVQRWVSKLTNAMYNATDILDLCLLEADKRREPRDSILEEKAPGCGFPPLFFCLRNPLFAHDIGSRIKELNQQLEGIHKEADKFKFTIDLGSFSMPRKLTASELSSYHMSSWCDESAIVGEQIHKDTKELAQMLITSNDNHNIKVVSIIGIAGIGKTTLAQIIFNEATIQEHFRCKIWLSITKVFDESELLRTAIKHAGGRYYGGQEDKSTLTDTLVHALSTAGRFLLVMDDVWSTEAWDHVLCVPFRIASKKQPGSRVIVTTRSAQIPRQMQAPLHQHRVRPLDEDDAWCLLKKQLSPDQVVGIDQLKDIGMEILKNCDGLPLAIKVVGGLLSMRYPSEHEWKSVLNRPAWSLVGLPPELDNQLYLSYENLSPQLKQCFLYCSLFPKGQKIVQRTITEMWASEGFVTTSPLEHELEDIAIEYYRELIKWNFIEPTEKYSLNGYMCSMNKVVHSFAEYMAREEALVVQREQQIESIGGQSNLLRRLSIESTESIPVDWAALQKQASLRVLIINCKTNFKPGDSFSSFSSLRVLHIVRLSESDRLVRSLCQLKHLRYLYLYESDISRLPSNIDQMKFLQYIGIVNCERFDQLPGNIIKLWHLRSLDLVGSNVHAIPRGFGSLTNLRSLFGFPVCTDDSRGQDWCSLEELAPLSRLRTLSLELEGIEKVDGSHLAANALISSKEHLSSLQLNYSSTSRSSNVSNLKQQLIEEVYDHLTPPPCIETLLMEGYFGRWLPNWMWAPKAAAFVSMRYLSLHNLASCTRLPDGLCQMPSLKSLEINKAPHIKYVGPKFLHRHSLEYAFPRLQELVLYDMVEWEEWEWNDDDDVQAMPELEVLLVESCKLRSLPPGLSYHARALRRLVITGARLLESLENFSSLVELDICIAKELTRIANLPRLQKLTVKICPKLEVLEGVPSLDSLVVEDYRMKTLPEYLRCVCPRSLTLYCSVKLFESVISPGSHEWQKICHIGRRYFSAYAEDGGYPRKRSYTGEALTLNSEDELTDDEPVDSDIPSGSAVNPADDELVGSDIPSGQTEVDSELVFPEKNDSELVGIEKPREEIIKMLMRGQDTGTKQLQVVSICGIGGLGKTSIARAIYRQIGNQFKCCAFVSVSQRHADNEGMIIEDIFDQVGRPYPSFKEDVSQQPIEQLIAQLKEFLQDKRYLIVLDNICNPSVWETIKPALGGNNHGSGIITTTYKADVAKSIGGVYRLPLLSNEDSKILFYRRTYFGSEDDCPSEYRESTKRILNKCGQLPLAIITFASLLPNDSPNSPEKWKKVADSIVSGSSELGDCVKIMRRILSRSYDNLPQHLRTCFLYLCTVPENYVIRRDSLVQRWLSEDLIRGSDGQNLQELGERYFYKLLDTGMIQPIEHDYDGEALACRVPVPMVDLIFSFANKEENRSPEEETIKSFRQTSLSISCSAGSKKDLKINKNLRVLELEGPLEKQHIAKYIGSLHQLKYLVLESTEITVIPRQVGKLQFLQTLDLRKTSVHELPSTFVGLKLLRCLLVNRSTKVPAGISNLQALEELQDIDISKSPDILEGICTLPELRVLKIALWSWDGSSSKLLPETLCKLITTKLKHLSICTSCSLEFKPDDDIHKIFQHIEKLEIQHSTFDTLPTWIDKLKKLSSLSIEVYLLKEGALQILGGLPDLLFLSLTAKKTPEGKPKQSPEGRAVGEDKLLVGSTGFSNLKTFHMFSRAIGIKFEQGSMKKLERLKLSFQASLTTDDLSFGLENLSSLKQVQVEIICFSATEKAVKKAEDAIRGMIWENPRLPRHALEIRRSAEEYIVEEKREFREELRDKILACRGGRTASVQKDKQKKKNA